LTLTTNSPR
jgi:THO complex subunit 4